MPTLGSLFAGIGGFDLGFERAGFNTVWQVEIDPYCTKVLEKNFPHAKRFGDIRDCGKHNLEPADVICGGFPCQDISLAGACRSGRRASGLWSQYARLIREIRPSTSSWKTSQLSLLGGLESFSETFPRSGMTRSGKLLSAADVGQPRPRPRASLDSGLPRM